MAKKKAEEKSPERIYLEKFAHDRQAKVVTKEFADEMKEYFKGMNIRLQVQEIRGGPRPEKFGEVIRIPGFIMVVDES